MDKSYHDLFFGESQEYIKEINKALVILEKDPGNLESINSIFRLMHTLKGMAATMGYKTIADFAHRLEDVFDTFRLSKARLASENMDIIFESIDAFTNLLDQVRDGKSITIDVSSYLEKLNVLIPQKASKEKVKHPKSPEIKLEYEFLKKFTEHGEHIIRIEVFLSEECPMKGVRSLLIVSRAKNFGIVIGTFPPEDALKEEDFEDSFSILFATGQNDQFIQQEMLKLLEVKRVVIHPIDPTSVEKKSFASAYIKKIQSMRIPVERLDKIMNIMGELSITKSRLVQTVQSKDYNNLEETVFLVERLVSSLQDEALKMRLLPISFILDNFPRIVRDLARKEGKTVDLEIIGSEIELDRVVLDEIGDSLVHLIRNSIDHGIETPEERGAAGKNPRGKILIKVSREKGHIIIEVSDDGKGVDFKEVMQKAIERKLLTREEAACIDSSQMVNILAMPGFSTKQIVTDVSGRGVGLDAVKNKVDALGGRIDLFSEKGKGSTFVLFLPLTLAIIKAMLVKMGEQTFAIPLMSIRETVKIKGAEVKLIKDLEVVRLREEIIPILRLDREFNICSQKDSDGEISLVIVEGRARAIGLVVDMVLGEQDIVVKPLGSLVKRIKGIAGATILGDGRVALILDIVNIR